MQTDGRRLHGQEHVQLGESLGVVEELRVRLRPLPATRHRFSTRERVRGARRPVVERGGSLIAIGTATTNKTELGETFGAVAKRPCRCIGEQPFELGLRQHALLSEQREQTPICVGDGRECVAPAQPAQRERGHRASGLSIRMEPPYTVGRTAHSHTPRHRARSSASGLASQKRTDRQEEARRSRCPPPRSALTASRRSKQRRQQLDRLSFLSSSERLDPDRAEPDLTVIDCLGTQRHHVPAAAQRIVIFHRLSTRQQGSQTATPRPPRQTLLDMRERSFYIDRPFWTPKIDRPLRRLTRLLQPPASGQRGVSDWSVTGQSRVSARVRSGNGFRLCIERCHPDPP